MIENHQEQGGGYVVVVEENNLSNLSGEASVCSSSKHSHLFLQQQQQQQQVDLFHQEHQSEEQPPSKKKRNLPGNPDPESEVIALSPNTLLATNRFLCEICNKGFQRDQNLQLHRRGHNLPWKLKQRSKNEAIRKKVYVCPEQTCVHHHPSRALGDLTGIKKHYSRKHGEKKWKCEKCCKRYAVQSDWKAHSKVCGTREYRCDCGTLFSRRDSFITHRAFCDALAEETARAITTATTQQTNTHFMHQNHDTYPLKIEPWHHHHHHDLTSPSPSSVSSSSSMFHSRDQNTSMGRLLLPAFPAVSTIATAGVVAIPPSHMSATALLQKAAAMGTKSVSTQHHQVGHMTDNNYLNTTTTTTTTTTPCISGMFGLDLSSSRVGNNKLGSGSGSGPGPNVGPTSFLHDMYNDAFGLEGTGIKDPSSAFRQTPSGGGGGGGGGGGQGLTRDFLGLKPLTQNDIFTLAGLGNCMTSSNAAATTTSTHYSVTRNT